MATFKIEENDTRCLWKLIKPLDAIVFDCDGTLSQIKGIEYLAKNNHVDTAVRLLTDMAKNLTGITVDIYRQCLDLVHPTIEQVARLGDHYYDHLTPDADKVIAIFQNMNKPVYVISAGIKMAVAAFSKRLGVPVTHIFAVDVYFDHKGQFDTYEEDSPIISQLGKCKIIKNLIKQHPRIAHIGDGINDVEAANLSERFIGYGGVCYQHHIAKRSDFYIKTKTLAPVLPLCLVLDEQKKLSQTEKKLFQKGLIQINQGNLLINK
ncbi:phosphoserine phosphatase [Coxiella-like endosymbiont of Amblyomma americanum]|nr:phosphoserine phosphatase [Coxiella-like endosymbiont of Amblyomma americanum]